MKYWLLTWNPNRWAWDELHGGFDDMKNRIKQVGKVYDTWSTGVNVSIKEGDRVFLIRLGKEPRGIVASGYAVTKVFISPHWDKEKALSGDKLASSGAKNSGIAPTLPADSRYHARREMV